MTKNIITVFGATGNQGGSVVNIFLSDAKLKNDWTVRGVTRDVNKDSSKKLAERGVEVVAADMDDKKSLVKAMEGSHTVFATTNYWEKMNKDIEIQQGKNLADAAVEAGVKHFIFQSLLNITKLSGGVLSKVDHFDAKADVEDYIRTLALPATFFMPGFYMSNFASNNFQPTGSEPDSPWVFAMPAPPTAPVPVFDAAGDTGKFVKGIVLRRDSLLGKRVYAATTYMTLQEVVDTFRRLYPETAKRLSYAQLTHEQHNGALTGMGFPEFAAEELYQNMRLLDEFGYYGGEELSTDVVEGDKLTTLEEFFRNEPKWASLK